MEDLYRPAVNERIFQILKQRCGTEREVTRLALLYLLRERRFQVLPIVSFRQTGQLLEALSLSRDDDSADALLAELRQLRESADNADT